MTALVLACALGQAAGGSFLHEGIRYETTTTHHDTEMRATLYAIDAGTGLPLWSTTVYALPRDPADPVPDVPVTKIWFQEGQLMVENARGMRYRVDERTHGSTRVPEADASVP